MVDNKVGIWRFASGGRVIFVLPDDELIVVTSITNISVTFRKPILSGVATHYTLNDLIAAGKVFVNDAPSSINRLGEDIIKPSIGGIIWNTEFIITLIENNLDKLFDPFAWTEDIMATTRIKSLTL